VSKDQIVIVTQTDDPHADDVIIALERKGHDPVRLNTDEIPQSARISMTWNNDRPFEAAIDVLSSGRTMTAEDIRSVWWRRPAYFGLPADLSVQESQFATEELDHALRSLWASLDCYWISEPERIRRASWKGEQLLRARRFGFDVPQTLVTTDPDEARDFFYRCGKRMIFKVMSDPYLGAFSLHQKDPELQTDPYAASTTTRCRPVPADREPGPAASVGCTVAGPGITGDSAARGCRHGTTLCCWPAETADRQVAARRGSRTAGSSPGSPGRSADGEQERSGRPRHCAARRP
jgi:hypothetical protein